MIYLLYDILLFLAYVIYLPFYVIRGRFHPDILTRAGFYKKEVFNALRAKDTVWVHAVSVGEARAAESLLRLIRSTWQDRRIAISTVTPTGYEIVKKFLKKDEVVFYAPLDITFAVNMALHLVSPGLLVIMETEIWPNLIRLAKKRGVPVVIVNGRISDRSFEKYKRFRFMFIETLKVIDLFCMQTKEAADRIISLGGQKDRVKVTGNIKFDISADLKEPAFLGRLKESLRGSLLFIAGSTHDGEEDGIVNIYKSLRKDFPNLRLMIAPRHLDRVDKIRRMIRLSGLEAINLSTIAASEIVSSAQVLVVNTIGDLSVLYRLSDLSYVGGSLVPKGGHNPIEPALFGKPIIFGRFMDNFKEIRDIFIREKAAIEVDDFKGLEYELRRLLASSSERRVLGENARKILDTNKGAAERTFAEVCKIGSHAV